MLFLALPDSPTPRVTPLLSNYPISIQAQVPWVQRPFPSVFVGGMETAEGVSFGEIC